MALRIKELIKEKGTTVKDWPKRWELVMLV